jgi:hypothetical protein
MPDFDWEDGEMRDPKPIIANYLKCNFMRMRAEEYKNREKWWLKGWEASDEDDPEVHPILVARRVCNLFARFLRPLVLLDCRTHTTFKLATGKRIRSETFATEMIMMQVLRLLMPDVTTKLTGPERMAYWEFLVGTFVKRVEYVAANKPDDPLAGRLYHALRGQIAFYLGDTSPGQTGALRDMARPRKYFAKTFLMMGKPLDELAEKKTYEFKRERKRRTVKDMVTSVARVQ